MLGWFRVEAETYWGAEAVQDDFEPTYLFASHGSEVRLNMTISESDYDEQAEMRLANEILKYTYSQVYDVGCDEIEAEAADYEERFIYFGSLDSF